MHLINVNAFLRRESLMREGKRVDRRAKVLDFGDDRETKYAILSHRWVGKEVDYDEIVELAKMAVEERNEIRQRGGYRKILDSCKQAQKDGYEWLWVDTCCIDKRSSAELSEAINSMYRWYENAKVCYTYLHDAPGSSFPTVRDDERYPDFSGWPEWFSRGWTLQELIAPNNVQFLNKDWQNIGDKRTLASILQNITGIPEDTLTHGLRGNRPCIAQIMSWASNRKTTRVEDRAYSLMGLLDVNMPMLYGEGKKAFHRLQLEIIRASNDQSIFAWSYKRGDMQPGSILADDPSCFRHCGEIELMDSDEFIKENVPEEELDSVEDRLGTFPITNRGGIQIWMLLHPHVNSRTLFQARLPCRGGPWEPPVTITRLCGNPISNRCPFPVYPEGPPQFRQVYLRYQDLPHRNTTFKIDNSALTENGSTCCAAYPKKFRGNTFTLTSTDPLCVKAYFDSRTNHRFVVGFGRSFGKDWIHVDSDESNIISRPSWEDYMKHKYSEMLARTPEHAKQMNRARSGAEQVCIVETRLPQPTRILQISSVVWKSSRMCGVKLEVFDDPGFGDVSGEWTAFDVNGTDDPACDWRGLMVLHRQRKYGSHTVTIRGVLANFWAAPDGIKLGDYGYFTDSKGFCCKGNLFADLESHSSMANITRQYKTFSRDRLIIRNRTDANILMLSLPSNDNLKSLLISLSSQHTNRYLVTRIVQCPPDPFRPGSNMTTLFYSVAKPLIWHRNESAVSVSEERSVGDELRGKTEGDQRVNDR